MCIRDSYVTHDQTEAMTLGTRIVVMKEGVIQQAAAPAVLYNNPINQFVAEMCIRDSHEPL